jgi:uncharacterized metal-binding protein YceD (DUF177 family)
MNVIDLNLLHSNTVDKIEIDDYYDIPSLYYEGTDCRLLENVHAKGFISRQTEDNDYVEMDIQGSMVLQDSISLEDVNYPFSIHIEGNLEDFVTNLENSLDILEFLWENIVLEIPLKFTKVEDLSKFHGDGWKLVSEEENSINNNPFMEYLKNIDEEE